MSQPVLEISSEALERLKGQAQRRGCDDLREHVRALIDADADKESSTGLRQNLRSWESLSAGAQPRPLQESPTAQRLKIM